MKFGRSSFILATLASSSSFKALAAPTESREQQHAVARQLPDPGVVTGALGGLPLPGLSGLPGGAPSPTKGGNQPSEGGTQNGKRQFNDIMMTVEGLMTSLGLGAVNPLLDSVGALLGIHGSKAAVAATVLNATQVDQVRALATNFTKGLPLPLPGGSNSSSPLSGLPVLGGGPGGTHAAYSLGQENDVNPSDNANATTPTTGDTSTDSATSAPVLNAASLDGLAMLDVLPVPVPGVVPGIVPVPAIPVAVPIPVPGVPPNTPSPPAGAAPPAGPPTPGSAPASAAGLTLPVPLPVPVPDLPVPIPDVPVHPGAPSPPAGAPAPPGGAPAPPSGAPAPPSGAPAPPSGAPAPPSGAPAPPSGAPAPPSGAPAPPTPPAGAPTSPA